MQDQLTARIASALERIGRESLTEKIYTTDPETVARDIVIAMNPRWDESAKDHWLALEAAHWKGEESR